MGRKKFVEDSQQRTLFSCRNFGSTTGQRASASQGGTAASPAPENGAAPTENRDANVSGSVCAQPSPKPTAQNAVGIAQLQLQHAAAAMAQQTAEALPAPAAAPARFEEIAVGKVSELRGKLNAEQLEAALAPACPPVFLLAGAGTGKTTTLIARVWHMIAEGIFPRALSPPLFVCLLCCFLQFSTCSYTLGVKNGQFDSQSRLHLCCKALLLRIASTQSMPVTATSKPRLCLTIHLLACLCNTDTMTECLCCST